MGAILSGKRALVATLVVVLLGVGIGSLVLLSGDDPSETPDATGPTTATPTALPSGSPTSATPGSTSPGATSSPTRTPSGTATGRPSTSPTSGTTGPEELRPRNEPVPITEISEASGKVSVELTNLEWVKGEATVPGEVGGDALRVTVRATNTGARVVEVPAVVVNLYYGEDQKPAGALLKPGSSPFPAEIPASGYAEGIYVFTVPKSDTVKIYVEVDLDHDLRIVSFEGQPRDLT